MDFILQYKRNLIYLKIIALELFVGSIMWEQNAHSFPDNKYTYENQSVEGRGLGKKMFRCILELWGPIYGKNVRYIVQSLGSSYLSR